MLTSGNLYHIGVVNTRGTLIALVCKDLALDAAEAQFEQLQLSILAPGFIPNHELPGVPSRDPAPRRSQS